MISTIRRLSVVAFLGSSCAAFAVWEVQPAASSVQFVTMKAGQAGVGGVSEVQKFTQFSGSLSDAGKLEFAVTLASVQTGFEIRDERLKTMLFKVVETPKAIFSAQLNADWLNRLAIGQTSEHEMEGQFTMGGQTKTMKAALRVTRLSASQLQVVTRQPLVVNANDYGMKAGVEALREVMGLNFLASVAPIDLYLVLKKQ